MGCINVLKKIRMAGGRADTAAGTPCIGADATLLCSDGLGCSTDFLLIPNSGGSGFAVLCISCRILKKPENFECG